MVVYNINDDFPFSIIKLGSPSALQGGGSYSAPLTIDGQDIFIQLPFCNTKSGIVETRRNNYCDLLYLIKNKEEDSFKTLEKWIETLQRTCCELIDSKKHLWFSNELSTSDLEGMMTPIARFHKQGTEYLLRVQLETHRGTDKLKCKIYDENENEVNIMQIGKNAKVIPLIRIDSIRFTSRSFDIILKLEQLMVLQEEQKTDTNMCMIKTNKITKVANENKLIFNDINETNNKEPIIKESINKETIIGELKEVDIGIEDLEEDDESIIKEIEIEPDLEINDIPEITLKRPNEIYYELYKASLEKAKQMKKAAINAFLEAKEIKLKYMLDDINDSDDENFEDITS